MIDDFAPRPGRPVLSVPPHKHKWQPVAIVYVPDGVNPNYVQPIPAVAQSCDCGAVQAVIVPGALR